MKNAMPNFVVAAAIAGLIVVAQWFAVRAGDEFTLAQREGKQYKVFSYGFPFRVVDCSAVLGMATPRAQVFWRLIGNWGTFLLIGVVTLEPHPRRVRNPVTSIVGSGIA